MRTRYHIAIAATIFFCVTHYTAAMVFMLPQQEKKSPPPTEQPESPPQKTQRSPDDYYSLSPSDLQKIETYVQSLPGAENQRITNALNKLETTLPNQSQQDCSQGVRKAIIAERGIDIFRGATAKEVSTVNGREAATNYGLDQMLKRNGYQLISSAADYTPQRGDIQSISYGKTINGYGGHVQYYDGSQWISDHKQSESAANPDSLRAQGIDPTQVLIWTYRRKT